MTLIAGSRHLGDEDLIRYMDHQMDREGQRRTSLHLRTCAECAARLEEMQAKSALVSQFLADLAVEMPDPGKRSVALAAVERARFRRSATGPLGSAWLRAAAVVLLLVAGAAFGTRPGRAWVAQTVVRVSGGNPGPIAAKLVEWLGEEERLVVEGGADSPAMITPKAAGEPVEAPGGQAEPAAAGRGRTERALPPGSAPPVRFDPPGPDVELVFRSVQDAGSATLWIRDVQGASGQITSGLEGERLVPTATGLEVRNRADSKADYVITIPARFRFVRVRVGDGPEAMIPVTKSKREWIWTIDLRTSALD